MHETIRDLQRPFKFSDKLCFQAYLTDPGGFYPPDGMELHNDLWLHLISENVLLLSTYALLFLKKLSHQKLWLRATQGLEGFSVGLKKNHRRKFCSLLKFYKSSSWEILKAGFKFLV
jgi:hypothetical protein